MVNKWYNWITGVLTHHVNALIRALLSYSSSHDTIVLNAERFRTMAVASAAMDCTNWDEDAYRDAILRERETLCRTVFRTAFVPNSNPNPNHDLIVTASSDGSIASYSISTCLVRALSFSLLKSVKTVILLCKCIFELASMLVYEVYCNTFVYTLPLFVVVGFRFRKCKGCSEVS